MKNYDEKMVEEKKGNKLTFDRIYSQAMHATTQLSGMQLTRIFLHVKYFFLTKHN
jgi:hypothetical protein